MISNESINALIKHCVDKGSTNDMINSEWHYGRDRNTNYCGTCPKKACYKCMILYNAVLCNLSYIDPDIIDHTDIDAMCDYEQWYLKLKG